MKIDRRTLLSWLLGITVASARRASSAEPPEVRTRHFSVPLVNHEGRIVIRFPASANYFIEDLGEGVTLEMAVIPAGDFLMGSSPGTPASNADERPVRRVSVKTFGLGVFELTRRQWERILRMPKVNKDLCCFRSPDRLDLPVDLIDWTETDEVVKRLRRFTGRNYRLPSEAEWEYACRAGSTTLYHFGDAISQEVSNFNDGVSRPIGLAAPGSRNAPNRFGLYDMHGNLTEWTADFYSPSYNGAPLNAGVSLSGDSSTRVMRGGMFSWNAATARSAARTRWYLAATSSGVGMRLAVDLPLDFQDPSLAGPGISNAASGTTGVISPGEIISLWGREIGPEEPRIFSLDAEGAVGIELSGTRVWFDDWAAPLIYTSMNQLNAVVPYGISGKDKVRVMVERRGQTSMPLETTVATANPGLFTLDGSGRGLSAALNQNGALHSPDNPARPGEIVSFFATGLGQTNPTGLDGSVTHFPFPVPVLDAGMQIGRLPAVVHYVGAAPGLIAGVFQINAVVPAGLSSGLQPVQIRVGGHSTVRDVYIFVQ